MESKSLTYELNTIFSICVREKELTKCQSSKWRGVKAVNFLGVTDRWQFLTKSMTHSFCQCYLPSPADR